MKRFFPAAVVAAVLSLSGCSKPNPILSPALPPPKTAAATEKLNPEYQAAIAELEKHGGQVQILAEQAAEPRVMIAFPRTQATDSDMELAKKLKISSLNLRLSKVTDRGLSALQEMTTLTVL